MATGDRSGYLQEAPNCVQFELVEGCSLACGFCGINGIREKPGGYKFVSMETVEAFCASLDELHYTAGWNPRIEFAMHGEPSMHPQAATIVARFRAMVPWANLMMTSNATGLNKKPGPVANVKRLQECGLNVLAIDCYEHSRNVWFPVVSALQEAGITVRAYPQDQEANPHKRRKNTSVFEVVAIADISQARHGNHSHLSNHAGAAAPLDDRRQGERCANPFRELAIRWDGNVAMCCNDWRGTAKIGNVNDEDLEAIWHSPAMYAFRRLLYNGMRTVGPCQGCTHRTYRNGLLPDKLGKAELPEPDEEDMQLARGTLAGSPYTLPVLRAWEK